MAAAMALGGFTGPEADTLGYAIRKKKSSVLRAQKEKFVTQAAERGVAPRRHRRRVQGVRAVRALRVQQGARDLLRAHRVPDRVPQGELHGRVHDLGADRVPRQRREGRGGRSPSAGGWGSTSARPTSTARTSGSRSRTTRSGSGCSPSRTSARARSSRSSRRARTGGEFRSLTDFCTRVDLRLANRKVLESLTRVGALNAFGHPAQILLGLDDALAAGQAAQRDRITGQTSLFDMGGDEAVGSSGRSPSSPETPVRERLALGEGAAGALPLRPPDGRGRRPGRASTCTAYSGDLKDESLDGQRVVLGGIVTGTRTVITKSRSTMAVVTLEDLPGHARGRRVPADRTSTTLGHVARRRDPARRGPGRPPGRGGVAARRLGVGLGHGRGPWAGGVRRARSGSLDQPGGGRRSRRCGCAGQGQRQRERRRLGPERERRAARRDRAASGRSAVGPRRHAGVVIGDRAGPAGRPRPSAGRRGGRPRIPVPASGVRCARGARPDLRGAARPRRPLAGDGAAS